MTMTLVDEGVVPERTCQVPAMSSARRPDSWRPVPAAAAAAVYIRRRSHTGDSAVDVSITQLL